MDLDRDLRRALARKAPAPGFAQRVMRRIERDTPRRRHVWQTVAASLLLVAVLGAWGVRVREQVLLAMHIAGAKAHAAQEQVREVGSR